MKQLLLSFLILATNTLYSQENIGFYTDLNGILLEGFYNELTYSPNYQLAIVHNVTDFELGKVELNTDSTLNGYVKFVGKKIEYKRHQFADEIKIDIDSVENIVIGIDSFFISSEFYIQKNGMSKYIEEKEPVQFITKFGDYVIAKHYNWSSRMQETYLIRNKLDNYWVSIPKDAYSFKSTINEYFGHIDYIKQKVDSEELDSDDLYTIIKIAEYDYKFNNSEIIYLNRYLQEVEDQNDSKLSIKIIDKRDSIYTLNYFVDSKLLYQGNYSSFYPHRKNGEFITYYENGNVRNITEYQNNKLIISKEFNQNKTLHYSYSLEQIESGFDKIIVKKFIEINDSLGTAIPEVNGLKSDSFNDLRNKSRVYRTFEKGRLIQTYSLNGNQKIYQIERDKYESKLNHIQSRLSKFLLEKKYPNAVKDNAIGIALIAFKVDESGRTEYKLISPLHPELDELINEFLEDTFGESAEYRIRFKRHKIGSDKVSYEVVYPICFIINRYYHETESYYNHDWLTKSWMMNQKLEFPQHPAPTVPKEVQEWID